MTQQDSQSNSHPNPTEIRKKLIEYFDLEGIQDLCMELGIDYEHLSGTALPGKARELVVFIKHRNGLDELWAEMVRARPFLDKAASTPDSAQKQQGQITGPKIPSLEAAAKQPSQRSKDRIDIRNISNAHVVYIGGNDIVGSSAAVEHSAKERETLATQLHDMTIFDIQDSTIDITRGSKIHQQQNELLRSGELLKDLLARSGSLNQPQWRELERDLAALASRGASGTLVAALTTDAAKRIGERIAQAGLSPENKQKAENLLHDLVNQSDR